MDWSARRRILYIIGVIAFFVAVLWYPAYQLLHHVPTCTDGIQNGDETGIDIGGTCPVLDARMLVPVSVRWSRAFKTTDGLYNAVAYVENPNDAAGVMQAPYRFKFYDGTNRLVAERDGIATVMPGSVTPIFEGRVESKDLSIVRAFFDFPDPLTFTRLADTARLIEVSDRTTTDTATAPRVSATVTNTGVAPLINPSFVAVVFDTAGNAFATSQTALDRLDPGVARTIAFTWPSGWKYVVGRIDILPVSVPTPVTKW